MNSHKCSSASSVLRSCLLSSMVFVPMALASQNPLNWDDAIGLTVNVEDSENCDGGNSETQTVTNFASLTGGDGDCAVELAITVTGLVETEDAEFDFVYVNDVLFFSGVDDDGECVMTTKTVTKTVTVKPSDGITLTYDTTDGQFHVGAYATITAIELVQSGCSSGCQSGGGSLQNGSVHLALNLGSAEFGESVGALRIVETEPSAVLGTTASLRYSSAWDGVELIQDGNGDIRQVKAPQCLADVVTETADKFRVDFYDSNNFGTLVNGIYDQAGKNTYVSWVIENLDTTDNDHLKITQVKGTSSVVNEFIWDAAAQGWELLEGNGQRKEKKTVVVDSQASTRTVTATVKDSADALVSKNVKVYKDFAWGRELIQSVNDPDGAAQTTVRTFHDNLATDGGAYSKLKSVTYPDGGWARYEYDAEGRLTKAVEPFLDVAFGSAESLCKVTTVAYLDYAPQETRVVTILGQEVERTYKASSDDFNHITESIVCTVPGAAYNDASNLVTARKLVSDGDFTGEVEWVSYPDGTGETYEYSETASYRTVVTRQGEMVNETIVSGTQTTVASDVSGNLVSEMAVDIETGLTISLKTVTDSDSFGRPTVIDYNDGTTETIAYGCCGIDSRTNREGITTTYTYDDFKRVLTQATAGITTSFTYDALGRVLTRKRTGSDATQIIQETKVYDVAGRLVSTTDALNNATAFAFSTDGSGRVVNTVTYPDGGTEVNVSHKDGRLYDISGTAVAPRRMLYGVESGEGYFEQSVNVSSTGGLDEWTKSWKDVAGRVVKTQKNGRAAATRQYSLAGKLEKTIDPDGVTILYSQDVTGDLITTILDADQDGVASALDRIETVLREIVDANGTVARRTEQRIVNTAGTEEVASQNDSSTNGLGQWFTSWGQSGTSTVAYGAGGTKTETLTQADGSTVTRSYSQGRLTSETTAASGGTPVLRSVSYAYDPHARLLTATDARNGTTTYAYDAMDRVLSSTTPAPGPGLQAQTTVFAYDSMGRNVAQTLPDQSQTTTEYFLTGGMKKRSGSQVPTVEYTYDAQGRMKTMVTNGQSGPSTTTWTYQPTTGWPEGKTYPGGDTISYTQTDAGRPLSRNTGRGISRTYSYDLAGRLTGVDYSDSTPDVAYTINRLGQITGITDGIGTRTRTFATDGRALSETHDSGLLSGASLITSYDTLLRRETHSVSSASQTFDVTWGYDGASRISSVTSGIDETGYTYAPDSSLITGITTSRGGTPRLTTTSSYDARERLTSISGSNGTTVVSSHSYGYDSLNRRTASVLEDGSEWSYQYDAMGQVISGTKTTSTGDPFPGMSFAYAFDGIGNRNSSTVNGRTGSYTANSANQYTTREVPGAVDIRGKASVSARVTMDTEPVERFRDYFYMMFPVDNNAAPQYPGVSVLAVQNNGGPNGEDIQNEVTGNLFLPKTPEVFTYDGEGNLTSDGRWNYTWDGENRLIRLETIATVPVAAKRKLEFAYDAESRRIRKQVFEWDGSNWLLQTDRRYLYDGWNLAGELDSGNTMLRNFVWGLDLSRTTQGAGGVGGLLSIQEGTESHLPAYDGNGNVMALVKASDQSTSARYEYGAFGETLVVEEDGIENPFRFSTKFHDSETDLYYYGYRYYDPVTGRWPSRDPISEKGGVNLYGMVYNNPVSWIDPLGLEGICDCLNISIVTRIRSLRWSWDIRKGFGQYEDEEENLPSGSEVQVNTRIGGQRVVLKVEWKEPLSEDCCDERDAQLQSGTRIYAEYWVNGQQQQPKNGQTFIRMAGTLPHGGRNGVAALASPVLGADNDTTQAPIQFNLPNQNAGEVRVQVTASSKICFNETYTVN